MAQELRLSFNGPEISKTGVPLADLHQTFKHLQNAHWLAVSHLEDATTPTGQAPAWIKRNCGLRLMRISPGSLTAELGIAPLTDARASYIDSSQKAIDLIMQWPPESNNPPPAPIAKELSRLGKSLSPEIDSVSLHHPDNDRTLDIPRNNQAKRKTHATTPPEAPTEILTAILHGQIMAVDWSNRTAQMHRRTGPTVTLQFDAAMDDEIHRLARVFVEVKGQGSIDHNDKWGIVQIEQIESTQSFNQPFDFEAFRKRPNPKVFDASDIVTASEPFDVDEFLRGIYEARGGG